MGVGETYTYHRIATKHKRWTSQRRVQSATAWQRCAAPTTQQEWQRGQQMTARHTHTHTHTYLSGGRRTLARPLQPFHHRNLNSDKTDEVSEVLPRHCCRITVRKLSNSFSVICCAISIALSNTSLHPVSVWNKGETERVWASEWMLTWLWGGERHCVAQSPTTSVPVAIVGHEQFADKIVHWCNNTRHQHTQTTTSPPAPKLTWRLLDATVALPVLHAAIHSSHYSTSL